MEYLCDTYALWVGRRLRGRRSPLPTEATRMKTTVEREHIEVLPVLTAPLTGRRPTRSDGDRMGSAPGDTAASCPAGQSSPRPCGPTTWPGGPRLGRLAEPHGHVEPGCAHHLAEHLL